MLNLQKIGTLVSASNFGEPIFRDVNTNKYYLRENQQKISILRLKSYERRGEIQWILRLISRNNEK